LSYDRKLDGIEWHIDCSTKLDFNKGAKEIQGRKGKNFLKMLLKQFDEYINK
jgi:hypothetical protein